MAEARRDDISSERDRVWYGEPGRHLLCRDCGRDCTNDARAFFNVGFSSGVRYGIVRTTRLSPHIAQFIELITYMYAGQEDEIQGRYAELYRIASDVHRTNGRDTGILEQLGSVLAAISSGSLYTQTTTNGGVSA